MEGRTIKLRHPVEYPVGSGKVVAELTFREPTGQDFRRLKWNSEYPIDVILNLAGKLTGQTVGVIDGLRGEDLAEVMEVASGFMPGGLGTGSEPSQS